MSGIPWFSPQKAVSLKYQRCSDQFGHNRVVQMSSVRINFRDNTFDDVRHSTGNSVELWDAQK